MVSIVQGVGKTVAVGAEPGEARGDILSGSDQRVRDGAEQLDRCGEALLLSVITGTLLPDLTASQT